MDNRGIIYNIRRKLQVLAFDVFGPQFMSKLYYGIVLKKRLNLNIPKTFNEKIQWYKLNYCPTNEKVIICSDKYRIREYLKEKGLLKYQVPLLGCWENANDIEWKKLPEKFVLKCNHGCAYNIICKNKNNIDKAKVIRQLNKWLREDFGKFNAEIHYSKIKPCIICEEFLESDKEGLLDYKVHCFNGKAKFILICSERNTNSVNYNYYDLNWKKLNYSNTKLEDFTRPDTFRKMIEISEIIAKDFPFVRVDFYDIKGKIFIGELTFVPAGGLDNTLPNSVDKEIGELLKL